MAVYLNQAKRKMLRFLAGQGDNIHIVSFVVGTGAYYEPTADQTALVNPVLTKAITSAQVLSDSVTRYMCKLELADCVGEYITEFGLVDNEGDLICIKTFSAKEKTGDADMTFTIDDMFVDTGTAYLTDENDNYLTDENSNRLTM